MTDIVKLFEPLMKHKHSSADNAVFQLHYKLTTTILIFSSILVSSKQFFGKPIKCLLKNEELDELQDIYCWIHGTYTFRNQNNTKISEHFTISEGVGIPSPSDQKYYHTYYQWVCVLLFVQAVMFYMPRYLWNMFEGGRIQSLSNEMGAIVVKTDKCNDAIKKSIVEYFVEMNGHNFYILRFALCEFLNLSNVIFQIMLVNVFLGGSFTSFGPALASFHYNPNVGNRVDPAAWLFPKMTMCTFRYFGSSGTVQNMELMCVLPLNVINEKLFAILWFWYMILAVISAMAVLFRIITICSPTVRVRMLMSQIRTGPKYHIKNIVKRLNVGDWFVLNQLGKSIDPRVLKDIVLELNGSSKKKTALI